MPNGHEQVSAAYESRLRTAFTGSPIDPMAVKDAVCAYVDDMKRLGAPVERVIVDIKRLAEIEDGPLFRAKMRKDEKELRDAKKLVEDAVRWCIDHYYHRAPVADGPGA